MPVSHHDKDFMRMAIELAKKGAGKVSPNPMVGAVLVKEGRIIGEGFHAEFGGNHAEVNAIGSRSCVGSTLYVTLEPCNHHGKTPPCTERILAENIKRVVIGSQDPDPRMQGNSIDYLKSSGIDVDVGVLKNETDELIRFYSHLKKTGVPYVTVKLALSKDGFIAETNGRSKWISSMESRIEVHKARSEYDAVMIGTNTLLVDNPALTVRDVPGRNPNRIVIDRRGAANKEMNVFLDNTENVFYFSSRKRGDLPPNVIQMILDENKFHLGYILKILGENDQESILVEGGAKIATSLIEKKLCSEIILYRAPKKIGDGIPFNASIISDYGFKVAEETESGMDKKMIYRRIHV